MKGGYKILWTPHALSELKKTIEYLEENFCRDLILFLQPAGSGQIEDLIFFP